MIRPLIVGYEREDTLSAAYLIARGAHGNQMHGDRPYYAHLNEVVGVLVEFGFKDDIDLMVSGYLHDTLEDTDTVTYAFIKRLFGLKVAELVNSVTNPRGFKRADALKLVYKKIGDFPSALPLKLADRIANTRFAKTSSEPRFFAMYAAEYPEFKKNLYQPGSYEAMWETLDTLMSPSPGGSV